MSLSKGEEQLMEYIWTNEKMFMKDIIDSYPEPKPAATTIATLLKRMQDKGFVGYNLFGNSRQYYAIVKKDDYFSNHVSDLVKDLEIRLYSLPPFLLGLVICLLMNWKTSKK